ncbi:hypothetical protein [Metabacillus sp. Hm71]|uniref:hypothetical protein n=1 Tax=Metabacillus sp. Hm71 TaxID=3450743 RepID=UPI003F436340
MTIEKQVQRYARNHCASFSGKDGCLLEPEGCETCRYFRDGFIGHKRCQYFERFVLPGDPMQELSYWKEIAGEAPAMDVGNCDRCGTKFIKGSGAAKYCDNCRPIVRKQKNAKRMREQRLQQKLKSVQIDEDEASHSKGSSG